VQSLKKLIGIAPVTRQYSNVNLGCGHRMASGLNAVFDRHDRAIILEDDCLPNRRLLRILRELLERYSTNTRYPRLVERACTHTKGLKAGAMPFRGTHGYGDGQRGPCLAIVRFHVRRLAISRILTGLCSIKDRFCVLILARHFGPCFARRN